MYTAAQFSTLQKFCVKFFKIREDGKNLFNRLKFLEKIHKMIRPTAGPNFMLVWNVGYDLSWRQVSLDSEIVNTQEQL